MNTADHIKRMEGFKDNALARIKESKSRSRMMLFVGLPFNLFMIVFNFYIGSYALIFAFLFMVLFVAGIKLVIDDFVLRKSEKEFIVEIENSISKVSKDGVES